MRSVGKKIIATPGESPWSPVTFLHSIAGVKVTLESICGIVFQSQLGSSRVVHRLFVMSVFGLGLDYIERQRSVSAIGLVVRHGVHNEGSIWSLQAL